MTNSKQKGKRGELEVVALLKEYGFSARRGQQYKGTSDSPDIIHDIPKVYLEVKFRENYSLPDALFKAWGEAAHGELPVVFHRKKRQPWMATMLASDFLKERKEMKDGSIS